MILTEFTSDMLKTVRSTGEEVLFFYKDGSKFVLNSIRLDKQSKLVMYYFGINLSRKSVGYLTYQDAKDCKISLKYIFSSAFRD